MTVNPSWIGSLFGVKPFTLSMDGNELKVLIENQIVDITMENLQYGLVVKKGLFFNTVSIKNASATHHIRWVKNSDANNIVDFPLNKYHQYIANEVFELSSKIKDYLSSHYPRKRILLTFKDECSSWQRRFKRLPNPDVISYDQRYAFIFVQSFSDIDNYRIEKYQKDYVSKQLNSYSTYFDNIESHPLTHQQRVACIADEDSNLVIAGAGSGKTSVMMGRAGYLVQSGQADANQILMLAFGRKAAVEMSERITDKLSDINIKASTFHSLGQLIVSQVEGVKPSLSNLAEDGMALTRFVDTCFQDLKNDPVYRERVITYFLEYQNEEVNPFEYKKEGEYLQALIDNNIRTLKGEQVKSFQESVIANYLLRKGVEYRYEYNYEHDTRTLDYRQYKPDFYLPVQGIYIEHYGIDENNRTAPYIDQKSYLEGMEWKRKLHKEHGTICIETFHYEHKRGVLLSNLHKKLIEAGVELQPLEDDAILDVIQQQTQVSEFTGLLTNMLNLYKMANMTPDRVMQMAELTPNPGRFRAAFELLLPIVDQYQQHLDDMGEIDFNDMINRAIGYLRSDKYKPTWKYIMVDEFQDISGPRAEIVKLLQEKSENSSIFCVGDDWQAIYRFAGSDLIYMTSFEEHFGTTCVTKLDMTFRFNNSISEVATRFVTQNPDQIRKAINTISFVDKPAVSLLRAKEATEEERLHNLIHALDAISKLQSEPVLSVLILGRYNFNLPKRQFLTQLRDRFHNLKIDTSTVHASKGNEADYVILVSIQSGEHGFPSEKITHPLLEALLPEIQKYEFAEERRLFYVALTRAKHRVYILCDMSKPSKFITELISKKYSIELMEFDVDSSQLLFEQLHCIRCKTGILVLRNGQHGDFYGCTHYPRCTHAENGCDRCGAPMKREGRYKICTAPACSNWVPVCPLCQAEMIRRDGPYGSFWGCRNYRRQGISCGYKEDTISPPH